MEYSDVTTLLTANWIAGNIALPSFYDKNLIYSLMYPHRLYINVYDSMGIDEISNGALFNRKQWGEIHGVYSTYADAEKALKECTRCIPLNRGWRLGGESKIIKKSSVFCFILRFFEQITLQGGNW